MREDAVSRMRLTKVDSGPDSGSLLKAMGDAPMSRWQGWRLRILVLLALSGCLMLVWLARETAAAPHLDGSWQVTRQGEMTLRAAGAPALVPHVGQRLVALSSPALRIELHDEALLQRSPRWIVDDAARTKQRALQQAIATVLANDQVTLEFGDGSSVVQSVARRTVSDLPDGYWLRCACALALFLLSMAILLLRPSPVNHLYVVMALCQAGNLCFDAVVSAFDLGIPPRFLAADFALRGAFDLIMGAALVHLVCLWPRPLPGGARWAAIAWGGAALALAAATLLPWGWWTLQVATTALAASVVALLAWSAHLGPAPFTRLMLPFAALGAALWVGLTVVLASTHAQPWWQAQIAGTGPTLWALMLSALLALTPLLSRRQQIGREFGVLVAAGAFVIWLEWLLTSSLGLNPFLAALPSLWIASSAHVMLRHWLLARFLGISVITTERMFERLYRIAREVESHPDRSAKLLAEFLNELFDPLQVKIVPDPASRTRVTEDGSTMQVPVPAVAFDSQGYEGAIVVRFAQRGNRLFTSEDIRLADRIVEQLERAVAYDRAVERGRGEERVRIAQDLHDDIGARLLTLIYKAQSPEMEEYARHTLQDLKTLTRGLAASSHRLSHAAGEWKVDLTHRLDAANIDLGWSCEFDDDVLLGMVQWSALTRILRELVSNTIAHSMASRVEVSVKLERDRMQLSVCDDGRGHGPKGWSHGLGLGGVRKRVKQLNGQVEWSEAKPHGICCKVVVNDFAGQSRAGQ